MRIPTSLCRKADAQKDPELKQPGHLH
jgi:hypothetical protein